MWIFLNHMPLKSMKDGKSSYEDMFIPSRLYIASVKAYNRIACQFLESRQYAIERTTGPCLVYYTFSSNIKQNRAFYGHNRQT